MGGQPFTTIEIDLPENAILALYTDGLIEAPGQDIEDGLAAVRAELRREPVQLEETADRMLSSLLPDLPHDDTVLVLARVRRTPRDES